MAIHRLIYRGATYEKQVYEPQPQLVPEVNLSSAPTVTLMYRGQTYQRPLPAPRAYQQPRALN